MGSLSVAEDLSARRVELPFWVHDCLQDNSEYWNFNITKGLGAGGTYGAACWHYVMCLINHESWLSWAIAPTFQQVQDTLIPTFSDVLSDVFGLEELKDYEFVSSGRPRLLLHATGQEIHFKSANRPERMVGPNISHMTRSEPGMYGPLAFEKSGSRLRCPKAKRLQVLNEGTPEGMGNYWETIGNIAEGRNPELKSTRITLWTDDNPALRPSYCENLEEIYKHDPNKLQSYRYGIFTPFTRGTAYWDFVQSRNVVLDVKLSHLMPLVLTFDFNVSPIAIVGLQRQPHDKNGFRFHRWVALWESDGNSRGLMDACVEFFRAYPSSTWGDLPIEIDGGHDGYFGHHLSTSCAYDQIIQYFKAAGYRNVRVTAARSAPTIQARLERVNALFAYEQYVIAAWCRNLIKSHSESCLKPNMWELLKKKNGDFTHYSDAVGYPLFNRTKDTDLENPTRKPRHGLHKNL